MEWMVFFKTLKQKLDLKFLFWHYLFLALFFLTLPFLAGILPIVRFTEEQIDIRVFPYNYLTAVPSYRADETGQIRMIRAKRKGQVCPTDAPVIMKIEVQDLQKKMHSSS